MDITQLLQSIITPSRNKPAKAALPSENAVADLMAARQPESALLEQRQPVSALQGVRQPESALLEARQPVNALTSRRQGLGGEIPMGDGILPPPDTSKMPSGLPTASVGYKGAIEDSQVGAPTKPTFGNVASGIMGGMADSTGSSETLQPPNAQILEPKDPGYYPKNPIAASLAQGGALRQLRGGGIVRPGETVSVGEDGPETLQVEPDGNAVVQPTQVDQPNAQDLISRANAPQTIETTTPVQSSGQVQPRPMTAPVGLDEPPSSQLFQTPAGKRYTLQNEPPDPGDEETYLRHKMADAQSYRPTSKLADIGSVILQSLNNSVNHTNNRVMTLDDIRRQRDMSKYAPRLQQIQADQMEAARQKAARDQSEYRKAQIAAEGERAIAEHARTDAEKARGEAAKLTAEQKPYLDQWDKSESFDPENNPADKVYADEAAKHGIVLKSKSKKAAPGKYSIHTQPDGSVVVFNEGDGTYKVGEDKFVKPVDNSAVEDKNTSDTNKWTETVTKNKGLRSQIQGDVDGVKQELQDLTDSNNAARERLKQLDLSNPGDVEEFKRLQREIGERDKQNITARAKLKSLQGKLRGVVDPPKPTPRAPKGIGSYNKSDFITRAKAAGLTGDALNRAIKDATAKGIIK